MHLRIPQSPGWQDRLQKAIETGSPPFVVCVGNAGMALDAKSAAGDAPIEIRHENPWHAFRVLPDLRAALEPYRDTFTGIPQADVRQAVLDALSCEGFDGFLPVPDKWSLFCPETGLLIVCDPHGEYPDAAGEELTDEVAGVLAIGAKVKADCVARNPHLLNGKVVTMLVLHTKTRKGGAE